MSREYKTSLWQMMYGKSMQDNDHHRRPPADWLFCRGDGPHSARPDMEADERAHFAKHFARDFAAALSEARKVPVAG